jgi:sporulation protein YlmC with PRC-barrel domain
MSILSLQDLGNMDMVDGAGIRLGAVKDLLFDPATGRICYAVVAPGQAGLAGALGIGERLVAIPFAVLRLDGGQLLLERDGAALAGAPAFGRGRPPGFDRAYQEELAGYWGAPAGEHAGGDAGHRVTAAELVHAAAPSVPATADLAEVARALAERGAEAAQVVDAEGRSAGIVTLRDVALALGGAAAGRPGGAGLTAGAGSDAAPAAAQADGARGRATAAGSGDGAAQGAEPAAAGTASGPARATGASGAPVPGAADSAPAMPGDQGAPEAGQRAVAAPATRPREQAAQEPDEMACPHCGATNRAGARFCVQCGAPLR